jgi:electron transport complex protein RnfA
MASPVNGPRRTLRLPSGLSALVPLLLIVAGLLCVPRMAPPVRAAAEGTLKARVLPPDRVRLEFGAPVTDLSAGNFRVAEASAPDAPLTVRGVERSPHGVTLVMGAPLRRTSHYDVRVEDPPLRAAAAPALWMVLVSVFLTSALIQNFVFTRYLGLCIFFGVSKKVSTSVGMGITFTAVMIATAAFSWAIDTWVLRPMHLGFLEILVFIGAVACVVQFLDTMLRKTHPALHKSFGVYLVLITTNCIILAVPLLNAQGRVTFAEAMALAVGSGSGFALALFLMSSARERMELARVPQAFQGLPIAFALAGLFALAFMGFSGLDFFR